MADFAGQVRPSDPATQLRMLWDRQAITDILTRYCHAIDRKDFDLLATCFHPDSVTAHGPVHGPSTEFIALARQMTATLRFTIHQISNITIDLDGDVARSETYVMAYHGLPAAVEGEYYFELTGEERIAVIGGRYVDRFEKRQGLWRIAHRAGIHDYLEYWVPDHGAFYESAEYAGRAKGERDPGYAMTRGWR